MKTISLDNLNDLAKQIIIFLVVLSLITAMLPTKTAKAESKLAQFFAPITDVFEAEEPAQFPVAQDKQPVKTITVVSTAYNSLVGQTDSTPCITANGHDLCKQYEEQGFGNTIAANFLKMGTQVKFPELYGDKIFVVRDRMNARYGYGRIDIWLPEYNEAKQFGVKRLKMEIF